MRGAILVTAIADTWRVCGGTVVASVDRMQRFLIFVLLVGAQQVQAQHRTQNAEQFSAVIQRAVAYHPAIRTAAARYGVDPHLLWAIAYLETRFRPQLVSPKGARGLMQLIPATGRRYGLLTKRDLHDPLRSIDAAARYLRDLTLMFDGRADLVLAGYNAGENAVLGYGHRVPPYRETRSYVARGLALLKNITRARLLASDRLDQLRRPQLRRPTCCANRPVMHRYPSPGTRTRSVYFSH
jgi:soluble lytic murein transglycosylase-like protein